MKLPLQIVFRNMERSESIEQRVQELAEKLDSFCDSIMSCRVVIQLPHRHHVQGNKFSIRIDITVPDSEIVVDREPSNHAEYEDINAALRDAFDTTRRQLEDYVQRRRHQVKRHEHEQDQAQFGQITKLLPEQDYGIVTTNDGRNVYFHANSVSNHEFAKLRLGTEVKFAEEEGDKGPQASTLRVLNEVQEKTDLQVV